MSNVSNRLIVHHRSQPTAVRNRVLRFFFSVCVCLFVCLFVLCVCVCVFLFVCLFVFCLFFCFD